jgi:hypothetical protein
MIIQLDEERARRWEGMAAVPLAAASMSPRQVRVPATASHTRRGAALPRRFPAAR